MRVTDHISRAGFPCAGVRHECHPAPSIDVDSRESSIVLRSEAAPPDPGDHHLAAGRPLFELTAVEACRDAGAAHALVP